MLSFPEVLFLPGKMGEMTTMYCILKKCIRKFVSYQMQIEKPTGSRLNVIESYAHLAKAK